jgi:outer membrane protein assembly factor BamD (BamD/ComL family)
MRAEEFKKAVETLAEAIKVTAGADHDLTAEAMYWRADSFTKDRPADMLNAYREFRKLTWDYPASKWAKYARGRLTARDMQQFAADE